MVFSSTIFLFYFLPLTLLLAFLAGVRLRNAVLLAASLLFYAWGEGVYVLLMLGSIATNYVVALLIEHRQNQGGRGRAWLAAGIVVNLLPLAYFKYGDFIISNLGLAADGMAGDPIHLPIGISFFTFQAISYIVDIYRRISPVQRNPVNIALYIALFPQLIAGPIVRYHDIARQLLERSVTLEGFAAGIQRFIIGLAKKVLIANTLGEYVDHVFAMEPGAITTGQAWLALVAYTLQIYFDFSGYSDMAIGLGRMFGFKFPENFNYPYFAQSIREFWRRWHISLSSWFRDYLYVPLGGNRKGEWRTYANLVTVFFLCGLWHGASWVFVLWGLYHGLFLVLERTAFGRLVDRLPRPLRHAYTLLVVMGGWVFFRAESLDFALSYFALLAGLGSGHGIDPYAVTLLHREFWLVLLLGSLFALPWWRPLQGHGSVINGRLVAATLLQSARVGGLFLLLMLVSARIASGGYNPFLYFRF